jgi:hypothetical protein
MPSNGVCCGDGRYKDFFSCEPPSTGLKGGDRAGLNKESPALGRASLGKERPRANVVTQKDREQDMCLSRVVGVTQVTCWMA